MNPIPSVLVIDDEERVRHLIRETLEQVGYDVQEARDVTEGLERYRANPRNLVIMDIFMPDQDGLECVVVLHRKFSTPRVIAVTGASESTGILNFLDVAKMLGAHRTLQKPFEM